MRRTVGATRGTVSRGAGLSRKEFLRIGGAGLAGAALLGSGTLAGCGGGGGSEGNNITLSWGPDRTGTLQKLVDKFNEQNKDEFQVNYREMPIDTGQYFDQLRTEFQSGASEIDVIVGDVIWPAQFAAQGYIADLTDRFTDADEFLSGPMESNTYDGKVYGVPWYTDAGLLYYRADLLEKAGFSEPPATWDELKEMALKIKQDEGIKSGFVFQGAEYEGGVCNGLEYILSHGGGVLDPNDPTKVIIESPESVAGFATERSMIEDGVSEQSVSVYKEDESHAAFLRGDSVFLRNWPYVYALLSDPEQSKIKPDQVDIGVIPVAEEGMQSFSTLGGWNFFINANSEKQDQAWEVIRWLSDPEQLKTNALLGSKLPTRLALYEDAEILEKVPVARLGKEAIIENSTPRPVSPVYSDMSLVLAEQLNQSLKGATSPEQAVGTLQTELQEIAEQGAQAG
jgi:multiple sugar transport system substrate-binding protein